MNNWKWFKRSKLLIALLLLTVVASGCVGARLGVSWSAVDTVNIYGEDALLVANNEFIAAVDPSNGAAIRLLNAEGDVRRDDNGEPRRWQVNGNDYEGAQFFADPIKLDDETLLFAAYNERFIEVDVPTARVEDSTPNTLPGQVISDIAEQDGTYYIPMQTGGIAAVSAQDYSVLWEFETEDGVWSAPLVVDGIVYFSSLDHFLYALSSGDGELIWKVDLEGAVMATPLHLDGHLYVGSLSHKIYDISLDGEILATYDANNWLWSTPVIEEGILYTTDLSGYVYALDVADNLSEIWAVKAAERGIRAAPIVTAEFVIVASRDGKVYWLDRPTGDVVFDREVEGRPEILADLLLIEPNESLEINEPLVIVSTTDVGKLLVAYEVENGRENWVFSR